MMCLWSTTSNYVVHTSGGTLSQCIRKIRKTNCAKIWNHSMVGSKKKKNGMELADHSGWDISNTWVT